MRIIKVQYSLPLLTMLLIMSCSKQPLVGNWKLQQVKVVDMMHKNTSNIDLTDPGKLKQEMLVSILKERQGEDHEIDTIEIKNAIERKVNAYLKAGLTFSNYNKFHMISNGLIVLSAIAGWHFGDMLEGDWKKNNDTLIMSIGDSMQQYTWKFKILELSTNALKLQGLSQGVEGTIEMLEGPRNELLFIRD